MNPFGQKPDQPPIIIIKQEKKMSAYDIGCAIGCGIPMVFLILAFIVNAITAPFLG